MFLQRGQFMLKVRTRPDILPRSGPLLYSLFLNRPEDAFSPAGSLFSGLRSRYLTASAYLDTSTFVKSTVAEPGVEGVVGPDVEQSGLIRALPTEVKSSSSLQSRATRVRDGRMHTIS